jgi:hypothetical protein
MDVLLILSLGALLVAQFVSWLGLLWCGPVVAAISAAILHKHSFGGLSGIAITVACLILLSHRNSFQHQADEPPREGRHNDITNKYQRHQDHPPAVRDGAERALDSHFRCFPETDIAPAS